MMARHAQASGSAIAAGAAVNGVSASKDRAAAFSWEDWFSHASPQQRATALGLAQKQGLLYPHQLPVLSNGVHPTAAVKETDVSLLLARLLAGKADGLPRLAIAARSFFDADLDELQRQAVARALGTPDLFLLQGLPGTGKSRVLTEIIRQAAALGRRVCFLAAQTASLDVVLERLVGKPEVFALRFLDTAEKPETLPAWLRGFTLELQKQSFLERIRIGARGNHEQAELACRRRLEQEPLWAELQSQLEGRIKLAQALQSVCDLMPHLLDTVEREMATGSPDAELTAWLTDWRKRRDAALSELDVALSAQQEALAKGTHDFADLAAQISVREPGYAAKKNGRFWTLAFWAQLFDGRIISEMEALLARQQQVQTRCQELTDEGRRLAERKTQCQEQFEQERAAHRDIEVTARRTSMELQQQALEGERRQLDEQWNTLCERLEVPSPAKTPEALAVAHQAWLAEKHHVEAQCQFAQQWTTYVEQTGAELAARLPSFVNVLAGTLSRWQSDAKFREALATPADLLIVEDADTLSEADLLKLARHAQRCVLATATLAETAPVPAAPTPARAPLLASGCWNRLGQALDGEARWPHTWRREHGRLICQLMPISADDRQHLECERLVDAADIELCILHRPRTQPCLAQVTFPPQHTFEAAFTFMVREVQEFPIEPLGRTGWWSEHAEQWTRKLGAPGIAIDDWLQVEPGLRLGLIAMGDGSDATKVACIEFAKSAGWDQARAEAWLLCHGQAHDHERTVFLQRPYRFNGSLAHLVQTVVRAGDWLMHGLPPSSSGAATFDFIPVPAPAKPDWPREGAGLELDLSASRHADRLPSGLRQGLSTRGFVNYLEAQALIRKLESVMQTEPNGATLHVAILALYDGQVELLRRLVDQSAALRTRAFKLEVALPSKLHQRECDAAFLSLTRSHAHRCVAFGEDARELPLALTRARSRLYLFGDPGSLCKRTSWNGPLDQLDAAASHQEQTRLSRLLAYLQSPTAVTHLVNGK